MSAIANIHAAHPADNASADLIRSINAPEPTASWHPIRHADALDLTVQALENRNMEVTNEQFGLAGPTGRERFFGVLDIKPKDHPVVSDDFTMSIGVGNSIDKSFPYRLVGGERVFVCSNLTFCGDFSVSHKHTSQILKNLPGLIEEQVGNYLNSFIDREKEIVRWKEIEIGDQHAAHTIMEAIKNRAISNQLAVKVYDEWRTPRHAEFKDRTVWSLQNAFTEIQKERRIEPNDGSKAMLRLMDTFRSQWALPCAHDERETIAATV